MTDKDIYQVIIDAMYKVKGRGQIKIISEPHNKTGMELKGKRPNIVIIDELFNNQGKVHIVNSINDQFISDGTITRRKTTDRHGEIVTINDQKDLTGFGQMFNIGRHTALGAAFELHQAMSNTTVIAGYADWLVKQMSEGNQEVINTLNTMMETVRSGRNITLVVNSDVNHASVIRDFIKTQLDLMENQ